MHNQLKDMEDRDDDDEDSIYNIRNQASDTKTNNIDNNNVIDEEMNLAKEIAQQNAELDQQQLL